MFEAKMLSKWLKSTLYGRWHLQSRRRLSPLGGRYRTLLHSPTDTAVYDMGKWLNRMLVNPPVVLIARAGHGDFSFEAGRERVGRDRCIFPSEGLTPE